jgi:uncharacterized membrane protein
MESNLAQRELLKFTVIVVIFAGILTGLKIYDTKTNEIQKLGSTVFSKILRQSK